METGGKKTLDLRFQQAFPEKLEAVNDPRREEIDISLIIPEGEHDMREYHGRLGQGKTYAMTADIINALNNGRIVYANYPILWKGFDERDSFRYLFLGLLGFVKKFYSLSHRNLYYIPIDENFHDTLEKLTDCIVALDEGYVAFDSYEMTKLSLAKRQSILTTRHYDRSIWYTVQRPSSIHVTLRSATNVFYRVTRIFASFGIVIFQKKELDLNPEGTSVDEDTVYSTQYYIGKKEIYEAYSSKYLRADLPPSQPFYSTEYHMTWKEVLNRAVERLKGIRLDGGADAEAVDGSAPR